jgi:hypothetical protein
LNKKKRLIELVDGWKYLVMKINVDRVGGTITISARYSIHWSKHLEEIKNLVSKCLISLIDTFNPVVHCSEPCYGSMLTLFRSPFRSFAHFAIK